MVDIIAEGAKKADLKTRLYVSNELGFITLLNLLGYREDKPWGKDEEKQFKLLCDYAKKHTEELLKEIDNWKKDGSP